MKVTEWSKKRKTCLKSSRTVFRMNYIHMKRLQRLKLKWTGKVSQKAEIDAQRQEQIMEEAYEEIRGGSGFSGDYKYDADILADSLATVQGKVYDDLTDLERSGLYDQALKRVSQDMLKRREARKALKDVEEKVELQMFDPKDRLPNQSGGLAYMLGEPNTRIEALQHAGVIADPKGLYTDPSIYSKGESEIPQNYYEGGGVGRGPWTKGIAPGTPEQPPQPETPVHHAQGQPDPTKAPQGIPSVAPRTMDPRYIQQQRMQQMMGQMGQQPRMRAAQGRFIDSVGIGPLNISPRLSVTESERGIGPEVEKKIGTTGIGADIMLDIGKGIYGKAEYDRGRASEDIYFEDQKVLENVPYDHDIWKYGVGYEKDGTRGEVVFNPDAERWEFKFVKTFNQGGRAAFGLGSMSRRAFLKMMAAVGALPFVAKGLTKTAPKVIPKVAETVARGADGMPVYITDLIEVVKAKGTRDIIEGFKRSDYSTVHSYKGVEVVEDGAGNIKIKKPTEGVATDASTGKMHEGTSQEVYIEINKGEWIEPEVIMKGKKGKVTSSGKKTQDEYIEGTVRPDMDGKMKDFEEFVDESDHLELKKIADERKTLFEDAVFKPDTLPGVFKKTKKASGGLAYMLGE